MTTDSHTALPDRLRRVRLRGLVVGGVGLGLALVGLVVGPAVFFRGVYVGVLFWLGPSLGCLVVLMIHLLMGGGWGFYSRRLLEAGGRTTFLVAVLFALVLVGMGWIYPWTDEALRLVDPDLRQKGAYLNVPFFLVRAVVYFGFWLTLATLLPRWSRALDEAGTDAERDRLVQRLRHLSAGGLVGYVVLMLFASTDWGMSLEPDWFSTVYGFVWAISQTLSGVAVTILALFWVRRSPPFAAAFRTKYVHDYGNLLLMFVMLWTYMLFMQYLVIWAGDLPQEITWYVRRGVGAWRWVAVGLAVFHFAVPFLLLLSRRTKRGLALAWLAGALLLVHAVYLVWLILPAYPDLEAATLLVAVAALVGVGGLWVAAFAWSLARSPRLLPVGDPRLPESLQIVVSDGGEAVLP